MTLRYFLLKAPSFAEGVADVKEVGWITVVNGKNTTTPPVWCDLIATKAYENEAIYDEEGNEIIPAIAAPGAWFLASIQNDEPPELIEPRIVSSWKVDEPMVLPEGVVAISPTLSGVII